MSSTTPGSIRVFALAPQKANSFAVPSKNRLGLHEEQRVSPSRKRAGEQHQQPTLARVEYRTLDRPRRHDELLSEHRVFG